MRLDRRLTRAQFSDARGKDNMRKRICVSVLAAMLAAAGTARAHDALDSFHAQFEALGEDWPRRSLVLVGMPNLSITICQSLTINLLYSFCAKAACEELMHRPRLHAKGARDAVDGLPRRSRSPWCHSSVG